MSEHKKQVSLRVVMKASERCTTAPAVQASMKTSNSDMTEVPTKGRRRPGSAKGLVHLSDDFDEPLEDFREYM